MNLFPEERETILGVSAALRARETSCVDVLKACIAQIEYWEPKVHAWAFLDLDRAMENARRLDREIARGGYRGPLHGIPVGIKDIIDVEGMPTGCGSKLWKDQTAWRNAYLLHSMVDEAGVIILGKTVTTAYAWIDPPATRNPWNLERTPGGSSSGSAAAVATGMCLGAIGTQTGGSIIRPASFCGVAGFKPSFSMSIMNGILPFAPSLDHVGPIARTVNDLDILFEHMIQEPFYITSAWRNQCETARKGPRLSPEIILVDQPFWERGDPSMQATFGTAIGVLRESGAIVWRSSTSVDFERVIRDHRTIMASEAAANHRERFEKHPDDYPDRIRSLIEEGSATSAIEYVRAKQYQTGSYGLEKSMIGSAYSGLNQTFLNTAILATPATLGPAPDLTTTGDSSFNAPWSFMGLPTITFPIGLDPNGLPLGIQLIGNKGKDLDLLAAAAWCERAIQAASRTKGG